MVAGWSALAMHGKTVQTVFNPQIIIHYIHISSL